MRVINQQLWCYCRGVGIVVLDPEQLQQLPTLAADDRASYGWVHDVAELDCSSSSSGGGGGDVVLATKHGLYHADAYGKSAIMLIELYIYALHLLAVQSRSFAQTKPNADALLLCSAQALRNHASQPV